MAWYAASAILCVKFKDGVQDCYPVWENVYLIEAETDGEAFRLAEERAREAEGDSSGSFRWDGRPATWVFAGLRKLLTVSHEAPPALGSGDELTFSEFELADQRALERLVAGGEVGVTYMEERVEHDDPGDR